MKQRLALWLLVAIGHLPLLVLQATGAAIGTLMWWLPTQSRRTALRNLALCFPEWPPQRRRQVARASLRHLGCAILEAPAVWFGPRRRLLRWVEDPGAAAILQQVTRGGAVMLCPHIGCWELMGTMGSHHVRVTTLYKPQKGVFDALIKQGRERLGQQLAPGDAGGLRAMLSALKRGENIGILPDQDPPPGSGEFRPLFGVAAHTPTLAAKLAQRSGVPMWFCYVERLPWARGFRYHFLEAPADADGTLRINLGVEAVVRHLPEQYWWSYRRFRRRPEGEADLYAG